jgi:hypothetical protein
MTGAFHGARLISASHTQQLHNFQTAKQIQTCVRYPAARCARVVHLSSALRGRGECRVPAAPAASRALCIGRTHTSNNEYTGTPGIPARSGFTAYVALSPVTGLFCHRRLRISGLSAPGRADLPSRELDASVGASGPHDFAVREQHLSSACSLIAHGVRRTRPAIPSRAKRCRVHRIPSLRP